MAAAVTWRLARGVQLQECGHHDEQRIAAQPARVDLSGRQAASGVVGWWIRAK